MNKFAKAGLAGAAALALAASGSTYALWSDYFVDNGNAVGADKLSITVAESPSGGNAFQFDKMNLAPGEKNDQENVITGRVGGADINRAAAYVTFQGLSDTDNGCGSQTEKDLDPTCGTTGDGGELSKEAEVVINRYVYTPANGSTPASTSDLVTVVKAGDHVKLKDLMGKKLYLGDMADGEKYQLRMTVALPSGATNAVQTDQSSWSIKYDLEQIPNS